MIDWIQGLEYGDVLAWVAAVGIAGALLWTGRVYLRNQTDRRQRDQAERRQQATGVLLQMVHEGAHRLGDAPTVTETWRGTAINFSSGPIYDVRLSMTMEPSSAGTCVQGGSGRADVVVAEDRTSIGGTFAVEVEPNARQGIDHQVLPYLEFTDANGLRWAIGPNYILREL